MSTGSLPFHGETAGVISEAILNRPPLALARLNPETPAELERIVVKALEKDRDLRYQTAGELRADLKRLRRDLGSGDVASIPTDASGAQPVFRSASVSPSSSGRVLAQSEGHRERSYFDRACARCSLWDLQRLLES